MRIREYNVLTHTVTHMTPSVRFPTRLPTRLPTLTPLSPQVRKDIEHRATSLKSSIGAFPVYFQLSNMLEQLFDFMSERLTETFRDIEQVR